MLQNNVSTRVNYQILTNMSNSKKPPIISYHSGLHICLKLKIKWNQKIKDEVKKWSIHIQSLRSLVCSGPCAFLDRATHTTTIPTTTTTTVAATGTAIFHSTQSGIHGNSILIPGKSRAGAIVPRINNDLPLL